MNQKQQEILNTIQEEHDYIKTLLSGYEYDSNPIELYFDNSDSRYNRINNIIIISFPVDYEYNDFQNNRDNWDPWKIELVHEMIHEFQYIVSPVVSEEGNRLYNLNQISPSSPKSGSNGFSGNGHDEIFYTAVDIFASVLNTTGDDILKNPLKRI
jgi:hypothetical protein